MPFDRRVHGESTTTASVGTEHWERADDARTGDAYWVKPNTTLSVPAPGILANDTSNGNGALIAEDLDRSSFDLDLHSSYSESISDSVALSFKAGPPGTETLIYNAI